jgi:hypothetical protein
VDYDRDEWMDGAPPAWRCPDCGQLMPAAEAVRHRHRTWLGWLMFVGLAAGAVIGWGIIFYLIILIGSGA